MGSCGLLVRHIDQSYPKGEDELRGGRDHSTLASGEKRRSGGLVGASCWSIRGYMRVQKEDIGIRCRMERLEELGLPCTDV